MLEIKYRLGEDALDEHQIYDTLPELLNAAGWQKREDGLWWQPEATQGCTQEEALGYEEWSSVRPFRIGTTGTVVVSYETTAWCVDKDEAYHWAGSLTDIRPASDFEPTDYPDSKDFDPWVKER